MKNTTSGNLYIVATPIGNLKDISLRALEILEKRVDLIAAEDTRHSKKLLQHYAINTKLISLHDYNEQKCSTVLIDQLLQGKNIALISDAGTPLISDPGYRLVKTAHAKNIPVIPLPGACAAIAALSASGLATDCFTFVGFLPAKKVAATERLQELASVTSTLIFYIAPHHLLTEVNMMMEVFGTTRQAVLAKELTKIHETIYKGSLADIHSWLQEDTARQKGEFVFLVHGYECSNNMPRTSIDDNVVRILQILARDLPPKIAAKLTAEITGVDKKTLYDLQITAKAK